MNRRPITLAALLLLAILLAVYLRSRPGHGQDGEGADRPRPAEEVAADPDPSGESPAPGDQTPEPAATENTVAAKQASGIGEGVLAGSGMVSTPEGRHVNSEAVEVASRINSPDAAEEEDLESVAALLSYYRLFFKMNPVADDNASVTRALTGSNPSGMILLPPDHPSIDGEGRLLDRWGTPFFFHAMSEKQMEIFSAGPDRKFDTGDDLHNSGRGDRPLTGKVWVGEEEEE
jgi:hypothetical protein